MVSRILDGLKDAGGQCSANLHHSRGVWTKTRGAFADGEEVSAGYRYVDADGG